jgi:UDP-N-acetyl-D-galactosamine dehydrogenase
VLVHDPVADSDEAVHEYGVPLTAWDDLPAAAALVAAVAHREFKARPLDDYLGKLQARIDAMGMPAQDTPPSWWQQQSISF